MHAIFAALGRSAHPSTRVALVAIFIAVTLTFCALAEAAVAFCGLPPVPLHAGLWAAWFAWHSVVFPRARKRGLLADPARAYRNVFFTNIVPGVSAGVSLMGTPLVHAILMDAPLASWMRVGVALAVGVAGAALLLAGFLAIGFASAGFLYEYVDSGEPIVLRGVYAYIRHPLFLGGVLASAGTALAFSAGPVLGLGAVNLAFLAIYRRLEDARLSDIFGEPYLEYRTRVPGFVPARSLWRSAIPLIPLRLRIAVRLVGGDGLNAGRDR